MPQYRYKFCNQVEDQEAIIDVLYLTREALYLTDRATCQSVVEHCFAHGGVFGVFDGEFLAGVMGFFYGEPKFDYCNKETVFMYVAAIRPAYQMSRIFLNGLRCVLQAFQAEGRRCIQLQAAAKNPYTTRLYGRFAQVVARGRSLRGIETITYGSSIEDALNRLPGRKKQPALTISPDELLTAVY